MILPFSAGVLNCVKKYNISFEGLRFHNVIGFIKGAFKFCLSQLFLSLKNYSPIMLISLLGGYTIAGQYKIIEQIIMTFRTYLQVVFRFFYPRLCYEMYKDKIRGIKYWKKVNFSNLILIISLLSIVYLFSENILIFFKVERINLISLGKILKYSLLIPLLITISFTLEQLLFSLGKKDIYIKITISTVIINFVMMFVLFKKFELYGLISSLLITEIMVISLYAVFIKIILKPNNSK